MGVWGRVQDGRCQVITISPDPNLALRQRPSPATKHRHPLTLNREWRTTSKTTDKSASSLINCSFVFLLIRDAPPVGMYVLNMF